MVFLAALMMVLLLFTFACGEAQPAAPTPAPKAPAAPAAATPAPAAPAAATPAPAAPAATPAPAAPAATPAAAAPAGKVAPATNWPTQPVTLIVPWAAGGDTDVPMRVAAEFIGRELGQPIVVQNITGASGTTGSRQARDARPDGYTLLSIHEHITVNKGTGLVDYGWDAFDPIANIMFSGEFMMTHANAPWNTWEEMVQDARQRPNQITVGVTFGSTAQMFAFMLMNRSNIQLRPVGYDGTAQRMTALLGGQLELAASPLSSAVEMHRANRVKVLGYAGEQRHDVLRDIPTFREQGYDVIWGLNRGWVAPKGTDPAIIARVEQAIQRATQNPDFQRRVEAELGSELRFMSSQQYAEFLRGQESDLMRIIQETGMTVPKK
jgi:tripartite-type tricarboxylate transporter receptor subunit TctC